MSDVPTSPSGSAPAPEGNFFNPEVTRRGLIAGAWGAFAAFLAGSAAATARYMLPNVLYEPSQRFKMGKLKDLPQGVTVNKENRVWVIRDDKGVYALWSRCTHLGCTPNWFQAESRFRCPCHGSNFNVAGDVIAGPAPKPLWRCSVDVTPDGDLVIDKSQMENRP
ncbi:MAG TPA: Rieske 2Fe-2S domain-containing protein, partial [Elusimicrobiota bacterium]|nr:Rieske 2Fe-2S domain-containing protein [Elusimicrobiota bacterium]